MLSRRDLLKDALAGSSALALSTAFAPMGVLAATPTSPLAKLLDNFFDEDTKRSPETATFLGQDKGKLVALKSRLDDRSPAGLKADLDALKSQQKRLKAIDRKGLGGVDGVSYDCVDYVLAQQIDLREKFRYGSANEGSPYVISQLTGSYQAVPTFLDTKHGIADTADAETYLARMEAFAKALDSETGRFRQDSDNDVVPAGFLLDTTLKQLGELKGKPEDSVMVSSLVRRTKDIKGDWAARASKIYSGQIVPALDRQIDAVTAARGKATTDAGVWHVKDGADWYALGLAISTTTPMPPDEIHQLGLDQAAKITAEMDQILKSQGLTQGSVSERIQAVQKDPASYYANDDAGKAEAIKDLQTRLDHVVALLPKFFHDLPRAKVTVERVPPFIEQGQALAYYQPPALDGSRGGTIYFNMADTHDWPKWSMPTTLYHEGMPGHHMQGAIAQETIGLPKYRANMFLSGYGEGWALYAEQLADELGLYENFPLGRLGYLNAQLFRCGRLVVDTGLHHKRWTREQAVKFMVDLTGKAEGGVTREVDRYCVWPGQACSYKIGHLEWVRLREKAKTTLAGKFDIRDFHKVGLDAGVMPLFVLSRVIEDYIKAKSA